MYSNVINRNETVSANRIESLQTKNEMLLANNNDYFRNDYRKPKESNQLKKRPLTSVQGFTNVRSCMNVTLRALGLNHDPLHIDLETIKIQSNVLKEHQRKMKVIRDLYTKNEKEQKSRASNKVLKR